jgi:hypothetical protein
MRRQCSIWLSGSLCTGQIPAVLGGVGLDRLGQGLAFPAGLRRKTGLARDPEHGLRGYPLVAVVGNRGIHLKSRRRATDSNSANEQYNGYAHRRLL